MCGRYALKTLPEELAAYFDVGVTLTYPIRYNVAPTNRVPVIRFDEGSASRRLDILQWGLVPSWAKDPSIGNRMINARAESAAEKPAFRAALQRRRCLVPADGFYEWHAVQGRSNGGKQPYFIHRRDGQPLAFAGIWEFWRGAEGADGAQEPLVTFSILTTAANQVMAPIHDRMPVIIERPDFALWLDRGVDDMDRLKGLLAPAAEDVLGMHPVTTRVSNPRYQEHDCTEPVAVSNPAENRPPEMLPKPRSRKPKADGEGNASLWDAAT